MTEWQLFLDESGDFDDPNAFVLVGGWLIRDSSIHMMDKDLRTAMSACFPWVSYPPHAWILAKEVSHVVNAHLSEPRDFGLLPAYLKEGVAWLRARSDDETRRVIESFQGLTNISEPSLSRLNHSFSLEKNYVARAIANCHQQFVDRVLNAFGRGWSESMCLIAMGDEPKPLEQTDCPYNADERYLTLVSATLERALLCLRTIQASCRLTVHILARGFSSMGSTNRHVQMTVRQLEAPFNQARSLRWRERTQQGEATVHIMPSAPSRFNDRTHAGLVLADFFCFHARHWLMHHDPWSDILRKFNRGLGCGPFAATYIAPDRPNLPSVGLNGGLREHIRNVAEGRPFQGSQQSSHWANEAGKFWIDALRRFP